MLPNSYFDLYRTGPAVWCCSSSLGGEQGWKTHLRFLFNSSTFALCATWHSTAVVSTSLQNIAPRIPSSELGEHCFRPGQVSCGLKVFRPMLKQVAALFPGSWVKSWWDTQCRKVGEPVTEVVNELDLSALSLWELYVCCLQSTPQTLHLFF